MAAFYLWVTTPSASTSYATIAAQMVVLGTGMGLTSAPATEAIMGVVPKAKAGVGSAVNDATRLLGGTLGVAVIGSVYASLYASRLAGAPCGSRPPSRAHRARIRRRRAHRRRQARPHRPPAARGGRPHAASSAFFHGFHAANYVAAGVAAAGALMALALLPAQPTTSRDDTPEVPARPASARRAGHSRRRAADRTPKRQETGDHEHPATHPARDRRRLRDRPGERALSWSAPASRAPPTSSPRLSATAPSPPPAATEAPSSSPTCACS